MVIMLRTIGIPARLVTGFLATEWNEYGQLLFGQTARRPCMGGDAPAAFGMDHDGSHSALDRKLSSGSPAWHAVGANDGYHQAPVEPIFCAVQRGGSAWPLCGN